MNPIFVRTAAVSLVVVLFACSDSTAPKLVDKDSPRFTCVSDAPGVDLPPEFRAQLVRTRLSRDSWIRTLPGGYAGFYTTEFGGVVLQFVDPVAGQSVQPVAKLLDDLGVSQSSRKYVTYERARWNLGQLWDWDAYLEDAGPLPAGSDWPEISAYRNAITVAFTDEASRNNAIDAYNAAGFPCNLIRTSIGYSPSIAR
jgi:hypothetical protein